MNNAAQVAIVLIGILVPAVFVLFVISITRRGRKFNEVGGPFATIVHLQDELHRTFAADQARKLSEH